jgi:halimadienyl-diphosphate synthase
MDAGGEMSNAVGRYFELLRKELSEVERDGGSVTPSVYDTAQVLRNAPPADARPVVHWLIQQQSEEGAWGTEISPLAQTTPTLAAVLALSETSDTHESREAVRRGLAFLERNAQAWAAAVPLPDDIPTGAELILPYLLDQAAASGLHLPREPFRLLREVGNKRRAIISRMKIAPGSTPAHSWEPWGTEPELELLDAYHSVGHSPAATAVWLRKRKTAFSDAPEVLRPIEQYLEAAARAAGTGIQGVVPTCWPINRWEQVWALLALFETDLLNDARLEDLVRPQLDSVEAGLRPEGMGLSDHFICDGDDTAAAFVVLKSAGRPVNAKLMAPFQREGQFITYPYELQPSVTTTVHGALTLALLGEDVSASLRLVEKEQASDGRWKVDKWHCSWLYPTSQALVLLSLVSAPEAARRGARALVDFQREDGGWGVGRASTFTETAFAARALYRLRSQPFFDADMKRALQRAGRWMAACVEEPRRLGEAYWAAKMPFATPRLDRIYEYSALIALELEPGLLEK